MGTCKSCKQEITDKKDKRVCAHCASPLHKSCAVKCTCGQGICDTCLLAHGKCKACEEKDSKGIELTSIRRSNIELYMKCPYAFKLQVIDNNPQPENIYTKSGIDMHDVFDKYSHIEHSKFTLDDMVNDYKKVFDLYPDDLFTEKMDKERMWERSYRNLKSFYELHETLPMPWVTEKKIHFEIDPNLPMVNITMDRIDEDGDMLIISDWKTGAPKVGKQLATDIQVPSYIYAVEKEYKRKVSKFVLYYLGEGKVREFVRIDDDKFGCTVNKNTYIVSLQETIRSFKRVFARIKAGDFQIPHDLREYSCSQCHLGNSGKCAGKIEQSWSTAKGERKWGL